MRIRRWIARFCKRVSPLPAVLSQDGLTQKIIVNEEELYVGSHNLTASSLANRREIGWIIKDGGTNTPFQRIWDRQDFYRW